MPSPGEILREAIAVSRCKVEWANGHIREIKKLVQGIIAENVDIITINNDTDHAQISVGPKHHIPVQLRLHMGDAVHSLNAATDYLWVALTRASLAKLGEVVTEAEIRFVSFPRDETEENLESRVDDSIAKGRPIYVAFPQAKDFIFKKIQPYKRPNCPSFIWHLNKLDIINKHRFLLVATHLMRFEQGLALEGSDGGLVDFGTNPIQTEGQYLTVALAKPVKIHHDPRPIVEVVIGEPEHFLREPIVETLINLSNAVSELIELFEETFV